VFRAGSSLTPSTMSSSSEKRLAPGSRQVDAFDPDDKYECDENGDVIEEISYITLDLGAVEPTLVPSSSTYRLIVRGHIPSLHFN
jgi:general transcription factor 3C polypeptide 6